MADTNEFDIEDSSGNTLEGDISESINVSIRFNATNGKLRRNGVVYSGTIDHFKLYDRNVLLSANEAVLLISAINLVITDGELIISQADVLSGLLSDLQPNTDYWFYLFNVDLTAISIGKIQPVLE